MMASTVEIFTIGHSNISAEAFVALLQQQRVTAIADVRSTPLNFIHTALFSQSDQLGDIGCEKRRSGNAFERIMPAFT